MRIVPGQKAHHAFSGSFCSFLRPIQSGPHSQRNSIKKVTEKQYFYTDKNMADGSMKIAAPKIVFTA
jgi:hypothetical protein